jgi:hypothetical protein
MSRTIYLVVETEYASSGNYRSNLEAYFSKESAELIKETYAKRQADYKERHPGVDSCVVYEIEETTLEDLP